MGDLGSLLGLQVWVSLTRLQNVGLRLGRRLSRGLVFMDGSTEACNWLQPHDVESLQTATHCEVSNGFN